MEYGKMTCQICGRVFVRTTYNQLVCKDPECRTTAHRMRCNSVRLRNNSVRLRNNPPKVLTKTCPICGNVFQTKYHQQVLCGSAACKIKYRGVRRHVKPVDNNEVTIDMVVCKCPMCGELHKKYSAPVKIMPRAYCDACREVASRDSNWMTDIGYITCEV